MPKCPTCDKKLNTEMGVKTHHARVHNESLVDPVICEVCGDEIDTRQDRVVCSGECYSEYMSEKMSGRDITWGDKISEEKSGVATNTGRRVEYQSTECKSCGNIFEHRPCESPVFCSKDCQSEWQSKAYSGSGNPCYRGGSSRKEYYPDNWDKMRKDAYQRDDYECQRCGKENCRLNAHHIRPVSIFDYPDNAHYMDNLVTLCVGCHKKVHADESSK